MKKHYLAILRCNLDDLPLLLTTDLEEARRVANECDGRAPVVMPRWDDSGLILTGVLTFNAKGQPIAFEECKDMSGTELREYDPPPPETPPEGEPPCTASP